MKKSTPKKNFKNSSVKFHKSMSLLFYYSQLWFYYAKLFETPEKDRQVLGFANSVVVDSDDEDEDILEPERS